VRVRFHRSGLRHSHKSNSRYCLWSSVEPLSSPSTRSGGRKIQALRKENPSQRKENPRSFLPRIEPFQRVAPAAHAIFSFSASSGEITSYGLRSYGGCAIGAPGRSTAVGVLVTI